MGKPQRSCCCRLRKKDEQEMKKAHTKGIGKLDTSEFINCATDDRLSFQTLIGVIESFMKGDSELDDPVFPGLEVLAPLNDLSDHATSSLKQVKPAPAAVSICE